MQMSEEEPRQCYPTEIAGIMAVAARMIIMAGFGVVVLSPCCGCRRVGGIDVDEVPRIEGEVRQLGFTVDDLDSPPDGWDVTHTGDGAGSRWTVVADETAPSGSGYVMAQTAVSPRAVFNLCVLRDARYADLKLSVAFKPVDGRIDQGGGLVWRYVDANNYYVCRFNPLEDDLRLYKVIAGKRRQLASVDLELGDREWHTLTMTMKGDLIVCEVDGTSVAVRDETLTEAGRIGFWTKADARTYFDTLRVTGAEGASRENL